MLSDTITLPVDLLNNGTPTNQVFTRADEFQNRSVYEGPSHSLISKDTLTFYRTKPTKSGNFNGTAKSALKFSTDTSVPAVNTADTIVAPMIGEVSFSLPVGCTAAQAKVLRQRMVAILDSDAVMVQLTELLHI